MKSIIALAVFLVTGLAYAGNGDIDSAEGTYKTGGFLCVIDPGKGPYSGNYFSGNIDGEAQLTNLVMKYSRREAHLEQYGLVSVGRGFELNLIEHLEDDSTIIKIQALKGHGRSKATFEIRNGEVVSKHSGVCYVDFKAGI
ncbi:hypothetical protein ACLVWU_11685 [Bdellovibrio sp. HCB290]|uniref:hypothetical protein n=1 Tax=Bdellovibrio sp. HCB290 TaxID=3394356 RepID=UPI0039B43C6B